MAFDKKKRKKILLVEDNREMLELITYFLTLRDSRVDVTGAMSAEEGMLELKNIDLLVVDLRLPGMSGIDLVKHARRRAPDLPAIIMSGMEREFVADQLEGVEIDAYVQKPYRPDEVTGMILKSLWGDDIPEPNVASLTQPRSDIYHAPLTGDTVSRLERLQQQTNAHQVILWALDGTMLYLFDEAQRRDADKLGRSAIASITGGLEMLVRSGSAPTRLMTVLDGDPYEIVLAHVKGQWDYCLAIIVDGEKRGTKLSTVWGAMQRAVADLSVRLVNDPPVELEITAEEDALVPLEIPTPPPPSAPMEEEVEIEPDPIASDEDLEKLIDDFADDEEMSDEELDDFWNTGLLGQSKSADAAAELEKAEEDKGEVIDERWEEVKDLLSDETNQTKDDDLLALDDGQDHGFLDDQPTV